RISDASTRREALHGAVVATRSVESCGRGTANDLNVLDVRRIQIGETVLRIGTRSKVRQLSRFVVDNHTIHDVERIGAGDEGIHAAQPHRDSASARAAGVLSDLCAGNLSL